MDLLLGGAALGVVCLVLVMVTVGDTMALIVGLVESNMLDLQLALGKWDKHLRLYLLDLLNSICWTSKLDMSDF